MIHEAIKSLYTGKNGELLKRHLNKSIDELDTVMDIKENHEVETKARQIAIKKMRDILALTEEEEPEQENDTPLKSKKYGLD